MQIPPHLVPRLPDPLHLTEELISSVVNAPVKDLFANYSVMIIRDKIRNCLIINSFAQSFEYSPSTDCTPPVHEQS